MLISQDPEMKQAIEELEQATTMYNNAVNKFRENEAFHRIKAALERIQAIRYERGEVKVEGNNGTDQTVSRTGQSPQPIRY